MNAKRRQVIERKKQKMMARFESAANEDLQQGKNDKQYDDDSDDFLPT
jgi:hypothetical protein